MLIHASKRVPVVSKTPKVKATNINDNPGMIRVTIKKGGKIDRVFTVARSALDAVLDMYPNAKIKAL